MLHGKSVALPEEELAGVICNEETLQQLDESTDDTFLDDYLEKYTRQEKPVNQRSQYQRLCMSLYKLYLNK